MTTIPESTAKAAAKWWADELRWPPVDLNARAKLDAGPLTRSLIEMLNKREREGVTMAKLDTFEEALALRIQAECVRATCLILSVDYDPCDMLLAAATDAEIECGKTIFPWKTAMWIYPNRIVVRAGYGAPECDVWPVA